jgi:hypothetical protein
MQKYFDTDSSLKLRMTNFATDPVVRITNVLIIAIFLGPIPLETFAQVSQTPNELAQQYCSACHFNDRSIEKFLTEREFNTEDQIYRMLVEMVENDFMPPSQWYRSQLKRVLQDMKDEGFGTAGGNITPGRQ